MFIIKAMIMLYTCNIKTKDVSYHFPPTWHVSYKHTYQFFDIYASLVIFPYVKHLDSAIVVYTFSKLILR